jgi:hypothetical protein
MMIWTTKKYNGESITWYSEDEVKKIIIDLGFWNENGEYIEDFQEIDLEKE